MNNARAVYFLYYAGAACLIPFLTLHYRELGLNGVQIGLLAGLVPIISMLSAPAWGAFSDSSGRHKLSLLLAVGGAFASVLVMSQMTSLAGLLPVVTLYAFFVSPIIPLVDNAVLELLGPQKDRYGRIRFWGGVGWIVAALLLGPLIERQGLRWAFYGFLFFMGLNLFAAGGLPMSTTRRAGMAFRMGVSTLLRDASFVALLAVGFCFGVNLGVLLNYQLLFLGELGASATLMTFSLALATLTELPFWFISDKLLERLGRQRMIVLGVGVSALRMQAMALMPAAWWILPVSLLNGPTFSVMWAAGVADADAAAPPGLGATAQGLFTAAVVGLGAAVGGLAGGLLYDSLGPRWLFQATAVMLVVAIIGFIMTRNAIAKTRRAQVHI